MRKFGLIGKKLSHSFSKQFFEDKFINENIQDSSYQLFEINSINEINMILEDSEIEGLNITIPFKQEIVAFLDIIDEKAIEIGAVNTVFIHNSKKYGYNTDYYGFKKSLLNFIDESVQKAIILGNGGASKAVQIVLKDLNIHFDIVSRSAEINFNNLENNKLANANLIINTTPLGMYPEMEQYPQINYNAIQKNAFFYDLVYNPLETQFLKKGKKQGAFTKNGLEMLHLQAQKSWQIWNKK